MAKTLIIAEAGVNHNGNIDTAKKLIDAASDAGADYIKFQTFKAEKLVSKDARKASYQAQNTADSEESQFDMLKRLELSEDMHISLIDHCKKRGIGFMSTAFDEESIDFLDRLGMSMFKIPSGEITNKPYLQYISRKGKPIILSTGMAELSEIEDALQILCSERVCLDRITVLHCNTEYPTPMKDVNLKAMQTIRKAFNVNVGYSDHTMGIEVPIAAVALGATIIEKHFTLDREMPGPDHKASLEPNELKNMVKAIRNIELTLQGDGQKKPSPSESRNILVARKSIHYNKALNNGHLLTASDLIMKRPGDGVSPMVYEKCIGRKLKYDVEKDQMLKWEDLE